VREQGIIGNHGFNEADIPMQKRIVDLLVERRGIVAKTRRARSCVQSSTMTSPRPSDPPPTSTSGGHSKFA
jgi:hypothetical protein